MDSSPRRSGLATVLALLWADKFATLAALFLLLLTVTCLVGPSLVGDAAGGINFAGRNTPPQFGKGFLYILGGDNLGRSLLARIMVGAQATMGVAVAAVVTSLAVGALLGLIAGYRGGLVSDVIMRLTDMIMSFPSLLTALVVLYVLGPSVGNLVIVLAITRIPVYLRTTRAEVMEARSRVFVTAAIAMGASPARVLLRHIVPIVLPTLLTIAAVDFATVIITESGLSFLGLGIQAPDFTWGSMVATGRNYIASAWWLSFWPGLAITLTALSLNILASWLRIVTDPQQRWRLEGGRKDD
ncbi:MULTISPECIES: ABC transporter permease [unclassified Shinella]|uniref:ABC transporter permease n=1 Tax=unclassified Shinella TaxID=2643062 RepID=UPI00234EB77D|nr:MULTISPECIES: ABC transporter permease [unclassified Shinella]MCO5139070.1 ABC transporter permease [Shinella sp.]